MGISKLDNKIKGILLGKDNKMVTRKGAQLEVIDEDGEDTKAANLIHKEQRAKNKENE